VARSYIGSRSTQVKMTGPGSRGRTSYQAEAPAKATRTSSKSPLSGIRTFAESGYRIKLCPA